MGTQNDEEIMGSQTVSNDTVSSRSAFWNESLDVLSPGPYFNSETYWMGKGCVIKVCPFHYYIFSVDFFGSFPFLSIVRYCPLIGNGNRTNILTRLLKDYRRYRRSFLLRGFVSRDPIKGTKWHPVPGTNGHDKQLNLHRWWTISGNLSNW